MTDPTDSAWRPRAVTPPPAERLAGYADLTEIGRGGDSVVYRARQVGLQREVAIKVLLVDDEKRAERFGREVEITLELGRQHPNIVTVLDVGVTDSGHPCIVMEYHEGGTLHDRLRSLGPLPVPEVITVGRVLADALAFAHGRGVLHRDVKPQNVLVLPTSWVLADFGIARLVDSEHTSSVETFTYRHASPQVLDGRPPTVADDIWSLGSTLYTLVDGRPPFASDDPDDDSALAYLRRARTEPYRPLTAPGVGPLAAVIDRCLAKDVAERWPTAAALRDALAALHTSAWEPGGEAPSLLRSPTPTPPLATAPVNPVSGSVEEPDRTAPRPSTGVGASPDVGDDAPPAEPDVLALSALAHDRGVPVVDAEPTGSVPDPTGPPPTDPRAAVPAADDAPRRSTRRRTVWALGATALLVGTVLGVGGVLLRGGGDSASDASRPRDSASVGIPTLSSAPTETGLPQVPKPDPALSKIVLKKAAYSAGELDVLWTDPSDGEGYFTLARTAPGRPVFVDTFPTGQLGADNVPVDVVRGVRNCWVITVALATGEVGTSQPRCLTPED